MNAIAPDAWKPLCHRDHFEMYAFTRAYIEEEHSALLGTPYAAEIRADDGSATLLHFTSAASLADFVHEMVPTLLEIHRAEGEDIGALVEMLQTAWDDARGLAKEEADSAIDRVLRGAALVETPARASGPAAAGNCKLRAER